MPDVTAELAGIRSPNPFWLASGPPTNTGAQVIRAFEAGWGGAVWKTLTTEPIQNAVNRLGAFRVRRHVAGINNTELISDRPLEVNLREMAEVKRLFPDRALVASLMLGGREEWQDLVRRCVDVGVDGLELNFGCPHGMCERGMGSVVGQEPRVNREITSWVAEVSPVPVLVKLTPNVADILPHGLAAQEGGADAVSLINTVNSLMGVDIHRFVPVPDVAGFGTHGGYAGQAVRPIALHMVGSLARDPRFHLPLSGIGGIASWEHAVEFMLLGARTVQVCTEVMLRGYDIVGGWLRGLESYMRGHGFEKLDDFIGRAVPYYVDWGELDLNHELVARIDEERCIGCDKCLVSCSDGGHEAIVSVEGRRAPRVIESECVGCGLCAIVCPVQDCITMVEVDNGYPPASWNQWLVGEAELVPRKGLHLPPGMEHLAQLKREDYD